MRFESVVTHAIGVWCLVVFGGDLVVGGEWRLVFLGALDFISPLVSLSVLSVSHDAWIPGLDDLS